jgi:hypothetical protein
MGAILSSDPSWFCKYLLAVSQCYRDRNFVYGIALYNNRNKIYNNQSKRFQLNATNNVFILNFLFISILVTIILIHSSEEYIYILVVLEINNP